jgi:hypothetical protein
MKPRLIVLTIVWACTIAAALLVFAWSTGAFPPEVIRPASSPTAPSL